MDTLNYKVSPSNNTGVNVAFNCDYEDSYLMVAMNPGEVHRVERLVESKILFDKTGKISEIQNVMKKYGHLYGFYLVDYIPPVDEAISQQFTKKNK